MAIDPNKLVSLEVLQRYISSTISLVKDNFAKKNMAVTNVELVSKVIPPDTEKKNYLKITYVDNGEKGKTHVVYNEIKVDLGSGSGSTDTGATADWVTNITVGGLNTNTDLTDMTSLEILKVMTKKYVNASATVVWSQANTVLEQSTSFNLNVTVNNFKNGDYPVDKVELYRDNVKVEEKVATGTVNFTTINNIAGNTKIEVKLYDTNGVVRTISTKSYVFTYPTFVGNSAIVPTETEVLATNKLVRTKAVLTQSYTANNEYLIFASPKSFGALTSIKDPNNFENLGSFIRLDLTVNSVDYYVYYTKNKITCTNFKYTFNY